VERLIVTEGVQSVQSAQMEELQGEKVSATTDDSAHPAPLVEVDPDQMIAATEVDLVLLMALVKCRSARGHVGDPRQFVATVDTMFHVMIAASLSDPHPRQFVVATDLVMGVASLDDECRFVETADLVTIVSRITSRHDRGHLIIMKDRMKH
jgi:hypothetical protein